MNSFLKSVFLTPGIVVSRLCRRNFKYKIRLKGKYTPTTENQYMLLTWVVNSLVIKPYHEQLELKHSLMKMHMKKVANGLRATYPSAQFPPHTLQLLDANEGLLCPMEPVVPSPVTEQIRYKEELSVGLGVDGREGVVGLFIGSFWKAMYCVKTEQLVTSRDEHKKIGNVYEKFIEQSNFAPMNFDNEGNWTTMRLRSSMRGDTMISVQFHPQELAQEQIEEAKTELSRYFLNAKKSQECQFTSLVFQECRFKKCPAETAPFHALYGHPYVHETVCGLDFRISPGAFFQINVPCAEILFNKIRQVADVSQDTILLDVCCGTGTIGQTMARYVKQVIGIDANAEALEDARFNAQLNYLKNTIYHCGAAEKVMKRLMTEETLANASDVVAILNPGRGGFGYAVLNALRQCKAVKKIVYVTCKPHGYLATNFVKLCQEPGDKLVGRPFTMKRTVPVDMFPHTRHCEMILLFER